jgi:hypothetical protein
MKINGARVMKLEVGKRYKHISSGNKYNVLSFGGGFGMQPVEMELKDIYGDIIYFNSTTNTRDGIYALIGAFEEITLDEWNTI